MEAKYRFEEKKVGPATINVYADRPQTVFEMFHKTVEACPEREAVTCGDICLSYAELDRRVDALASYLKNDCHAKKGDRVVVFLPNNDIFPTAFLAISKIGGISVVLNTRLTRPELVYQLELTKPVAAVVDSETWDTELDELVPPHGGEHLAGRPLGEGRRLRACHGERRGCPHHPLHLRDNRQS